MRKAYRNCILDAINSGEAINIERALNIATRAVIERIKLLNIQAQTVEERPVQPITQDDIRRCRIYVSHASMTTKEGLVEWIVALLDHIEETNKKS